MAKHASDAERQMQRLIYEFRFDQSNAERRYMLECAAQLVQRVYISGHYHDMYGPRPTTTPAVCNLLLEAYLALDQHSQAFGLLGAIDADLSPSVLASLCAQLTLSRYPLFKES